MTGYQIFLAYIALGAGIIIALTLIVLIIVLWRKFNKENNYRIKLNKVMLASVEENNRKIKAYHEDYIIKTAAQSALTENVSKRLDKFEKQQTDENAAIYNAFRGNHNETLTKINSIDKTIEQHTNRLNLDNKQIERILIKLTPAPKNPEKYKVERPKKLGKHTLVIGEQEHIPIYKLTNRYINKHKK